MWIFAVTGVLSLIAAIHLWARRGTIVRRLVWTPIVAVPAIGPLLYLGMYEPLRPLRPGEQASERNHLIGAGH
jgi:hypothetical protein